MEKTEQVVETHKAREPQNEPFHPLHDSRYSLLVIGTETAVFDPASETAKRIYAYAAYFSSVHIIVVCGLTDQSIRRIRNNITLYPASSRSKFGRLVRAASIVRSLRGIDIVSTQDPFETGLLGVYAAKKLRAALHVQVHTDFLSPHFARLSVRNRVRTFIAPVVLSRAARIRAVSERIRRTLAEMFSLRAPITVLPIFVDIGLYRDAIADSGCASRLERCKRRMLVVARLEPEKNVALAIRAFAKAALPDSCLVIVGDGSERIALEKTVHSLGLKEQVFFEGQRDALPYYPLSDLVLVPSRYEGYGRVIVEALAARKPVLSTDVGVARESGAIIAASERFAEAIREWATSGPREAHLSSYPYKNFDAYARAYASDIAASANSIAK